MKAYPYEPSKSSLRLQKIIPCLWYDTQAVEAAELYVSLFKNSEILSVTSLSGTPSGEVETVEFRLSGLVIAAISAGPHFTMNPSASLMVNCSTRDEVDRLYNALSDRGIILMPLDSYPFSERYAWLVDRFGLSWQLFLTDEPDQGQQIRPCLLFAADACGKAEQALSLYPKLFNGASVDAVSRYDPAGEQDPRAEIQYAELVLEGLRFVMMDHGAGGEEVFNEAFSFMVSCENQEELDSYWGKLSHDPESEQCGWLKDTFGVSWQIVPQNMNDLLQGSDEEVKRVTEAFLEMGKLDVATLEAAKRGAS